MNDRKVYTYKFGKNPVEETVQKMIYHIDKERSDDNKNKIIRDIVFRIVSHCPSHDISCMIKNIFLFVRNGIRYIGDNLDQEYIVLPSEMLRRILYDKRLSQGDCDDHAMLLATLLVTAGIGARFKVIAENKNDSYHHIYVEAYNRDSGKWIPLDAIHKNFRPGQEVPHEKSKTFDMGIIEYFE